MICTFRNCDCYGGTVRFRPGEDESAWTVKCGKVGCEIRASHCPKQGNSTLDGWC